MHKFKCNNKKCIGLDEDENRLMLIVTEEEVHKFYINEDGTLEHYDSDGNGQEIILKCPNCRQKYEFNDPYGYFELKKEFVLPFTKRELKEIKINKIE